jgi:hypothetical protein
MHTYADTIIYAKCKMNSGVFTTSIDSQQQRVTVTGNIEAGTLIKKLMKTGKHAEIWPEKVATKEKESGKAKSMHSKNDQNQNDSGSKKSVRFSVEGLGEETKRARSHRKIPPPERSCREEITRAVYLRVVGQTVHVKRRKRKGRKVMMAAMLRGAQAYHLLVHLRAVNIKLMVWG